MADKLQWLEQHPVLLRDLHWRYAVEKLSYKIRADLQPMFDENQEVLPLMFALKEYGATNEACNLLARMLHPRAAVWWGYVCLLTLLQERKERELHPEKGMPGLSPELEARLKALPFKLGEANLEDPNFKMKDLGVFTPDMIPKIPKPSMNDPVSAAASEKIQGKTDALRNMLPPKIREMYETSKKAVEMSFFKQNGATQTEIYQQAKSMMMEHPVVCYDVNYNSPEMKALVQQQMEFNEKMDQGIDRIKASFPQDYPKTPQAALLFKQEDERLSQTAIQAVYQWVVAPDEINSNVALNSGNEASSKPEGLLALTAFWSFGDLTPEGKNVIPTPPSLAPTGLASSLLMMALEEGGPRLEKERYELYFDLGLEVMMAKNLWPNAVKEELTPHEQVKPLEISQSQAKNPDQGNEAYKRWK